MKDLQITKTLTCMQDLKSNAELKEENFQVVKSRELQLLEQL